MYKLRMYEKHTCFMVKISISRMKTYAQIMSRVGISLRTDLFPSMTYFLKDLVL